MNRFFCAQHALTPFKHHSALRFDGSDDSLVLPDGLDYTRVAGLSTECRLKLSAIKPRTLGQTARIDGITPIVA